MKIEVEPEEVTMILRALDHMARAYENTGYGQLCEELDTLAIIISLQLDRAKAELAAELAEEESEER